ncbi:hypothetical protein AAHA92_14922 [Salvia divinorum]|uniref:Uncharacterized protein n=1 Tax=Salvia divinorum TaxID=28513 RepID=A0ABD1HD36_SALDI
MGPGRDCPIFLRFRFGTMGTALRTSTKRTRNHLILIVPVLGGSRGADASLFNRGCSYQTKQKNRIFPSMSPENPTKAAL